MPGQVANGVLQPWRDITVGSRTIRVWFTSNAIYQLEILTGSTFQELLEKLRAEKGSFAELQALLFAGLEGARLKLSPRQPKWTIERVGDLIDEGGGMSFWTETGAAKILGEAIIAAQTSLKSVQKRAADNSPDGGAEVPQTAASTGEVSSMPPSTSDS